MRKTRNKLLRRLVEGQRIRWSNKFSLEVGNLPGFENLLVQEYNLVTASFRDVHPKVNAAVFCTYAVETGLDGDDFIRDVGTALFTFSIKRII